jgi:hypothetical protein
MQGMGSCEMKEWRVLWGALAGELWGPAARAAAADATMSPLSCEKNVAVQRQL